MEHNSDLTLVDQYKEPLVSIIVVTYNSEKYVLETLESTKAQTYTNIELIVSDDCSTDCTIEICRKWLLANKDRFIKSEIVSSEKNTGISGNCNRGIKSASGVWIKLIAGDDVLGHSCILDNIDFITINLNVFAVFSTVLLFDNDGNSSSIIGALPFESQKSFFCLKPNDQYYALLEGNCNWLTPSSFLERKIVNDLGCFDERFPMLEDYPFWLKLTKSGIKLWYFDKVTTYYRQNVSLTRNSKTWINKEYFESAKNHFIEEVKPDLCIINSKLCKYKMRYIYKMLVLLNLFMNKKTFFAVLFNKVINKLFVNFHL